jgi:regulator of sigma E protease
LTTAALIIIAVLLFELIILVHEGGHFLVAKKCGVKVNEFAIGMGPKLFSFTKGETLYSFRLFPIGGFCAMEGEDEVSGNPRSSHEPPTDGALPDADAMLIEGEEPAEPAEPVDPSRSFNNAKIWKRMLIIIAGAVMNILLGLVFMLITLLPKDSFVSTTVSLFSPSSFSAVTGLQSGDKIVSINGYAVNTSTDFSFALYTLPVTEVDGSEFAIYKEDCAFDLYAYAAQNIPQDAPQELHSQLLSLLNDSQTKIAASKDQKEAYAIFCDYYDRINKALGLEAKEYPEIEIRETRKRYRTDMTVIRDGERVELKDVDFLTTVSADSDKPTMNIDFYVEPMENTFGTVISETFGETVSVVRMVWGSLIGLIKGQFSINDMAGPVGLASAITQVASETLETSGFGSAVSSIIYIMMVITINLGIVNMLPFPALDGGRFLFLLIEWIFRKPIPRKVESIVNTVGLVLLLGLSAVIAVKDVLQLIL